MRALLMVVLVGGCGFSAGLSGGDDAPDECAFTFTPQYVDPCTIGAPSNMTDVILTGATSIDTNNGELTGENINKPPPHSLVNNVRVVWVKKLEIKAGATVRAYGDHPLIIISTSTIAVDGTINVSSDMFSKGAGANPAACNDPMLVARAGQPCLNHGGSGGGGGGFGAAGGDGGKGADGHMCDAMDGKPGGAGGKPVAVMPDALRGGCQGGNGSPNNDAQSMAGIKGDGGGAIGLVAASRIVIGATGVIHAGGAGGQPGRIRAGGGGGGSGGMIYLESIDVSLDPTSLLAANGGGGAGGCDSGTAFAGEHGEPTVDNVAAGGMEDNNGGTGGNGGLLVQPSGAPGNLASRGGGGGGGGVGIIRVRSMMGATSGRASPAIRTE